MSEDRLAFIDEDVASLKEAGLFINLRTIESAQGAWLTVDGKRVLNFCSNNYLGLANDPRMNTAARDRSAWMWPRHRGWIGPMFR